MDYRELFNDVGDVAGLGAPLAHALIRFSVIWPMVEKKCWKTNANDELLRKFVVGNIEQLPAVTEDLERIFDYFHHRYFAGDRHAERLSALCPLTPKGKMTLVQSALKGIATKHQKTKADKWTFLLLVIYRLRNNLFHGAKWASDLHGQEENFENANHILLVLLAPAP